MIIKDLDLVLNGRSHTVRIWKCCKKQWEMIITPVWHGSFANFKCPDCGDEIDPPPVPMDKEEFDW